MILLWQKFCAIGRTLIIVDGQKNQNLVTLNMRNSSPSKVMVIVVVVVVVVIVVVFEASLSVANLINIFTVVNYGSIVSRNMGYFQVWYESRVVDYDRRVLYKIDRRLNLIRSFRRQQQRW